MQQRSFDIISFPDLSQDGRVQDLGSYVYDIFSCPGINLELMLSSRNTGYPWSIVHEAEVCYDALLVLDVICLGPSLADAA